MKKTAFLGMFSSVAIILGYVETLLPVFVAVPGVKLGLANLVAIYLLYRYSWKEAALVSVIRIVVIGFLFGNLFSILFSLAGAALSLISMAGVKRISGVSTVGVSITGGVTHNLGQIIVAVLVLESGSLFYYFPALMISGLLTGSLIGILSAEILKRTAGRKRI